ncbi:sulfatase-like hydrolase/transferase [Nocardioides sp. HB32]
MEKIANRTQTGRDPAGSKTRDGAVSHRAGTGGRRRREAGPAKGSGQRIGRRGMLIGAATGAVTGTIASGYGSSASPASAAAQATAAYPSTSNRRPNVLWVITDDMTRRQLPYMRSATRRLVRAGSSFTNGYTAVPWCGPARASMLTSMYPHNHGCLTNHTHTAFVAAGLDRDTVATRMHDAGYTTGYFGKYMNEQGQDPTYVAPGWDRFVVLFGGSRGRIPVAYDGDPRAVTAAYGSGDQVVAKELRRFHPCARVRPVLRGLRPHQPS